MLYFIHYHYFTTLTYMFQFFFFHILNLRLNLFQKMFHHLLTFYYITLSGMVPCLLTGLLLRDVLQLFLCTETDQQICRHVKKYRIYQFSRALDETIPALWTLQALKYKNKQPNENIRFVK